MRGSDERSGSLFIYVDLEARVRVDHPLRTVREIANAALADLTGDFAALHPARLGRPSIAPERLLRAMLLQAFYGIRSERQLMERMEFDLLFRWFVGLGVDDPAWDQWLQKLNNRRRPRASFIAPGPAASRSSGIMTSAIFLTTAYIGANKRLDRFPALLRELRSSPPLVLLVRYFRNQALAFELMDSSQCRRQRDSRRAAHSR